ncbi:MAG TPA: GNAT family N-acetyltransferase [Chloroflexia bacterium]|nr:GNAT family N-acetyltransferase [Chloroflexia bacterium]
MAEAPVEIKPAGQLDWPFLAKMIGLTMRSLPHLAVKSAAELESMARLEMLNWQASRDFAFIAWKGNERAGAVWLHAGGEPGAQQYTLSIAVAPAFQHQGVGSGLLQYALDFSRRNSGLVLNLKVHPSNEAAIRLYRRFGFEVNLLEMKLRLSD